MIPPTGIVNAPPPMLDFDNDWDDPSNNAGGGGTPPPGMDPTALAIWRERERRQRTIRVLMMFLLMLLLMDGEEAAQNKRLRKRTNKKAVSLKNPKLDPIVFASRMEEEARLRAIGEEHPRYRALVEKNGGKDVSKDILKWAEQQAEQEKDEFAPVTNYVDIVVVRNSATAGRTSSGTNARNERDPEEETKVFHYPWNATGFYRGEWTRTSGSEKENTILDGKDLASEAASTTAQAALSTFAPKQHPSVVLHAPHLESDMLNILKERKERLGVFVLPPNKEIKMRNDNNLTSLQWERMTVDASGRVHKPPDTRKLAGSESLSEAETSDNSNLNNQQQSTVTLTHDSGRAAFQLFSRAIPSMKEISLVDGFVKLYDSNSPGYSTRKDILLRVRGVIVHSIGRISLVSNVDVSRSAFVIGSSSGSLSTTSSHEQEKMTDKETRRRRLMAELQDPLTADMNVLVRDAISLYSDQVSVDQAEWTLTSDVGGSDRHGATHLSPLADTPVTEDKSAERVNSQASPSSDTGLHDFTGKLKEETEGPGSNAMEYSQGKGNHSHNNEESHQSPSSFIPAIIGRNLVASEHLRNVKQEEVEATSLRPRKNGKDSVTVIAADIGAKNGNTTDDLPEWSHVVLPYPFVRDDLEESIRKTRTPAARRMPPREQLLEANAVECEFEINMNVQETEWTVGAWRSLLTRRVKEANKLDPTSTRSGETDLLDTDVKVLPHSRAITRQSRRLKDVQDQALVMTMYGAIYSPNCDFRASLNATAQRTDWEAATSKAINYSFYMMIVCLTQILVLLRQLLHSQTQSAATRVSLLAVGWQTVIDALVCFAHIYLSLAMQPLFTAFASVAFFKLLIFCVIEMKYMAMILQARNSSNGGITAEALRRQVAMLHLRFYVALFGAFLLTFYVGDKYRLFYMLGLYSFWVPQIVLNVITEAKTPLHKHYIYGMSLTRLVAPFYALGVSSNFLKEVYPDSPTDVFTCQMLVAWVGIQTAVLLAQGKYGARFFIPARFLPPKFDYNRPLPASMLPKGALDNSHLSKQQLADDISRIGGNAGTTGTLDIVSLGGPTCGSAVGGRAVPPVRRHSTAVTTRNRIRGSQHQRAAARNDTKEEQLDHTKQIGASEDHTLDCSICYEAIDVRNRKGYMLAPCSHLFHKDCLSQWMDIKMECPVCRNELPAL